MTASNTYFYLPGEPRNYSGDELKNHFNALLADRGPQITGDYFGSADMMRERGFNRMMMTDGLRETEALILTGIEESPFKLAGDERKGWIRVRISSTKFSQVLTDLTNELDGWAGPDSKDFTRLNTGNKLYLYLGGEQNIKVLSRTDAVNLLNLRRTDKVPVDVSVSEQELLTGLAQCTGYEAIIDEQGRVVLPVRPKSKDHDDPHP